MESMPVRTRSGRLHSRFDWSRHMATIKRLYIDEDLTLSEVMETMEQQHGFRASAKMYKVRLKRWGLSKYITTKPEDLALLPDSLREKELQPGVVRLASGRLVDVNRLASHLSRKKVLTAAGRSGFYQPSAGHRADPIRVPSPQATAIRSPDILYISEAVLSDTRIYMANRMGDMAHFLKLPPPKRPTSAMITSTIYASRDFLRGGKVDEAVGLLRNAPRQMHAMLRDETPLVLEHLFMTISHLGSNAGPRILEIIKALVRYAAAAAAELGWPPQHPLRRLLEGFARLNEQDPYAQYDLAKRSWMYVLETLDSELGVPECSVNFPRWLDLGESAGYDSLPGTYLAERQGAIYRQKVAECGPVSIEVARELFFLTDLERQRVMACGGSQATWQQLAELTLRTIPEGDPSGLTPKANCELNLADIHKGLGDARLAEKYLRACIATSVERFGEQRPSVYKNIVKLEGWLAEWGEDDKVAELQPWKARVRAKLHKPD